MESRFLPLAVIKHLAVVLLAFLVVACEGSNKRPDVILIVVDTLRADYMGLYGYGRETTPELEALARGGAVFDSAYSGSSWTLPAMAMLFSGAYDGRNSGELDQVWPSLPESFQAAGYQTSAVVANPILGGQREDGSFDSGFGRGFETFEVVRRRFGVPRGIKRQTNGWYADEVIRRAKLALDSKSDKPRFLWLQLFDPHFPRQPADPSLFLGSQDPGPGSQIEASADERDYISRERRLYAAEVAGADAALGDLFAWLRQAGRLSDTVVVVTSDHGEGLWQRKLPTGENPKAKNSAPRWYSDHGIMLTEEQVHVPLIFFGPGVPAGERVRGAVSLVDVAPTLRGLCDLPASLAPEPVAGFDLFGPSPRSRLVYSFCSRGASVIADSRWRLSVPSSARTREFGDSAELFDLSIDPLELTPLKLGRMSLLKGAPNVELLMGSLEAMRTLATPKSKLDGATDAARRDLLDDLGYFDQ